MSIPNVVKALHGQRVLVTRPAHQAANQINYLRQQGADPVALPLLDIVPTSSEDADYQQCKQCILDLDLYRDVVFVSPNAARIGADWIDAYWPQLPLGVRWVGIGQQTTDTLTRLGFPAWYATGGFDSETLLAHPSMQNMVGAKVLILRAEGGRDLLADTLRQRGARVDFAHIYRRTCPQHTQGVIQSTIYAQPLSAILITSGQALRNLIHLCAAFDALTDVLIIVPSARLAELANSLGFNRIRVAQGPDDQSMVDALLPA
ncbi:uroporphyrinogen-III synthase [Marinobacterium marinum]|uniref:Uroporphyrinogen-III synthase n=1 Tax=Marinobacterium marinum TaxID=2756129 RepID=A0A7W1WWU2_9GAMM|nr:uroporphyrinogen-III synthase [Marinobacterium marinum]MBA4501623.1 uroporphyrinogen-III synthase [Marinobacterium marinum]